MTKYFVKTPHGILWKGPYAIEFLKQAVEDGHIGKDWIASPDQVLDKTPVEEELLRDALAPESENTEHAMTSTLHGSNIGARYMDGYRVARMIIGFGQATKTIGILLAISLAIAGFVVSSQASKDLSLTVAVTAVALAIIVGLVLFLLGMLVAAQGQILRAVLDTAVNGSPLLSDQQKAQVMGA